MPIIDVAHQHLITARANGGDQLDWSSMVAGQRMSAGLPPFTKKVSRRGALFRRDADSSGWCGRSVVKVTAI